MKNKFTGIDWYKSLYAFYTFDKYSYILKQGEKNFNEELY